MFIHSNELKNNGVTSVREALVPPILAASPPNWLLFLKKKNKRIEGGAVIKKNLLAFKGSYFSRNKDLKSVAGDKKKN